MGQIGSFACRGKTHRRGRKPIHEVRRPAARYSGPRLSIAGLLLCLVATGYLHAASAEPVSLSGAANFRDIGRYRTTDGRRIKSRVIYRSGELSGLTLSDQKLLSKLRIRYEFDLRTDQERAESPSRWGANPPKVFVVSVGQPRNADISQTVANSLADLTDETKRHRRAEETYARMALNGAPEIGEVIKYLADGDEPALIHCTAGQDRTGVTVAILMSLLRVPKDEVYREYLKSNEATDQQIERVKVRAKAGATVTDALLALSPATLRQAMHAEQSSMEAMFRSIEGVTARLMPMRKTA